MIPFILCILKIVVIYIYIFNPVLLILGFGSIKLLYIPACCYILFNLKSLLTIRKYLFSFFLIILFAVCHFLLNGDSIQLNNSVVLFIECILLPIWIINKIIGQWNIYKVIFIESIIAAFISLFMVMLPEIGLYIKESILLINEHEKKFWYRGFGFATDLFYSYAIFHGIVLSGVLKYIYKCKMLVLLIPIYIVAIFLNARSGFIPVLLIIIYLCIKNPIKYLLIILSFVIIVISLLPYVSEQYSQTITWAIDFFYQVYDIVTNQNSAEGSTTDAMAEMIYFPRNIVEWLIGTGYNLLYTERSTDIGYLIQLNYGGLSYLILWIIFFYKVFKYFIRKFGDKIMAILIVLSILILNIKGDMLCSNIVIRTFFLLVIYYKFNKNVSLNIIDEKNRY